MKPLFKHRKEVIGCAKFAPGADGSQKSAELKKIDHRSRGRKSKASMHSKILCCGISLGLSGAVINWYQRKQLKAHLAPRFEGNDYNAQQG